MSDEGERLAAWIRNATKADRPKRHGSSAGTTGPVDYDEMITRGAQHDELERLRIEAATRALPE